MEHSEQVAVAQDQDSFVVGQCMKRLYSTKVYSDITFLVGPADSNNPPREFKAHRLILALRAQSLADLMLGDSQANNVRITDMSPRAFDYFLELVR